MHTATTKRIQNRVCRGIGSLDLCSREFQRILQPKKKMVAIHYGQHCRSNPKSSKDGEKK